jgi:hypothetical protein
MAAIAWPAQGTILSYSTDGGNTYNAVGQIVSLSHAGGGSVGERDTTILTSTVHTNAPTIPDNGEVSMSLNIDPTDTQHKQIQTWKESPPAVGSVPLWKAVFNVVNTNTTKVFLAWVKDCDGPNAEGVDDNITMDVTLRVTGNVTSLP